MRAVHAARPYWFEVFTIANLILITLLLRPLGISVLAGAPASFFPLAGSIAIQLVAGGIVRFAIWRRAYLRAIGSREWIIDTLRIGIVSILWAHTYAWIKLTVPLLNPRLFDVELRDISRAILFNHSANIFLLELFSRPAVLRVFDWMYAWVFVGSLFVGAAYFLSSPDRELRIRFTNASSTMWLIGAWMYVAVPSLGPAYFFPDVWQPLGALFQRTQLLQRLLMTNYQIIVHHDMARKPVTILFGIAAFPSMHVAFETLTLLFLYPVSRLGRLLYLIIFIFIFLGSMITGWHYLIDALAGIVLAFACWAAFQRALPRLMRHATTD